MFNFFNGNHFLYFSTVNLSIFLKNVGVKWPDLGFGYQNRARTGNYVESVLAVFLNPFMHVFSYVLDGSNTNCNCSGDSGGGSFDN